MCTLHFYVFLNSSSLKVMYFKFLKVKVVYVRFDKYSVGNTTVKQQKKLTVTAEQPLLTF